MSVDEMPAANRRLSEAAPFLAWIIANYDRLPEYVVFLHGDQYPWHVDINTYDVEIHSAKPEQFHLLSYENQIAVSTATLIKKNDWNERAGIHWFTNFLWHLPWYEAHESGGMRFWRCCSESVVNRDAIIQHPKALYEKLLEVIILNNKEDSPLWGYIFEINFPQLFIFGDGEPIDIGCFSTSALQVEKQKSLASDVAHVVVPSTPTPGVKATAPNAQSSLAGGF